MNIMSLLFLSLVIWAVGFVVNRFATRSNTALISCPAWLFYCCGLPKNKELPLQVLFLRGILYQTIGFSLAITRIIFQLLSVDKDSADFFSIVISVLASLLLIIYLKKRRTYIDSPQE